MKRASNLLIVPIMLVAAACSSGSSPQASASEETATPTPEPTPAQESSAALPSLGGGAGDFAALLPTEIGGLTLQYSTVEGADVFGADELTPEGQAFLDQVGAQPDAVSMAVGFAFEASASDPSSMSGISILAFRVEGQDEATLRAAFIQAMEQEGSTPIGDETTVGGKAVTSVGFEGATSGYLYVHDDIVYLVSGEPVALAEEALAALP